MGVKGLWQLIEPTGKPVTLQSLEGKTLAVDASIWLNQTVKGMRDRHGNPLPNAHLIGLFHRVCKLLYYRIKPVFVFDGATPALKKQTLAARRQKKEVASQSSQKATKKLLENLLKQHALRTVLGGHAASTAPVVPPGLNKREADLYQLPPETDTERGNADVAEESAWEMRMEQKNLIYEQFGDLEKIDIDSEEFKSLPADVRHEILTELKLERKQNHWSKMHEMPQEAESFSDFQVSRLMTKNKLSRKIDHVVKELNAGSTADVAASLAGQTDYTEAQARRIVSEDAGHYILIKGLSHQHQSERAEDILSSKKEKEEESSESKPSAERTDDVKSEPGSDISAGELGSSAGEPQPSTSGLTAHVKTEPKTLDSSDDSCEENTSTVSLLKRSSTRGKRSLRVKHSKRSFQQKRVSSSSSEEDVQEIKPSADMTKVPQDLKPSANQTETTELDNVAEKLIKIAPEGKQKTTQSDTVDDKLSHLSTSKQSVAIATNDVLSDSDASEEGMITGFEDTNSKSPPKVSPPTKRDLTLDAGGMGSVFLSKLSASKAQAFTVPPSGPSQTKPSTQRQQQLQQQSSSEDSEDEGFIEITIDPTTAVPDDDLFPASVFETPQPPAENNPIRPAQNISGNSEGLNSAKIDNSEGAPADGVDNDGDVRMDEEEQRQLQKAIEDSLADGGIQSGSDSGTEVSERIDEPKNVFEGLSREELLEVTSALEEETSQIQKQRGALERIAVSITEQMSVEAQALLELFGVPYVISPAEAEAQCAFLDLTNQTAGTITDDSDIWLFGGKTVYKNFFNQTRHVELYREAEIHRQLLLDRCKMINLALMCGSDYTTGVQGIGPVTALEVLAEFPGAGLEPLKALRKWWDVAHAQKKVPSETKVKVKLRQVSLPVGFPSEAVRDAYVTPDVDQSEERFSWAKPNIALLTEFSRDKLGWTKDKTDETLEPVVKSMKTTSNQTHITSFFAGETLGEPKKMKSKRILQTLTRMRHAQKHVQEHDESSGDSKSEIVKTEKYSPMKVEGVVVKSEPVSQILSSSNVRQLGLAVSSPGAPLFAKSRKLAEGMWSKKAQSGDKAGRGRGRGQGRGSGRGRNQAAGGGRSARGRGGRATGSIPVSPVELVLSTGRGRRDPHVVVLSESSSEEEAEAQSTEGKSAEGRGKQRGGFL